MNLALFLLDNFIDLIGGKDNALVLSAILSFLATLFLVLLTGCYVLFTKKLSETNLKSLDLTEKTSKIQLTLDIIYNFDREGFAKLMEDLISNYSESNIELQNDGYNILLSFTDINQSRIKPTPKIIKEVEYFVNYFDTMSILYLNKKLDEDLFKKKILDNYFITFIINFSKIISERIAYRKKISNKAIYCQENFLILAVKILREYINSNIGEEMITYFKNAIDDYQKILT